MRAYPSYDKIIEETKFQGSRWGGGKLVSEGQTRALIEGTVASLHHSKLSLCLLCHIKLDCCVQNKYVTDSRKAHQ